MWRIHTKNLQQSPGQYKGIGDLGRFHKGPNCADFSMDFPLQFFSADYVNCKKKKNLHSQSKIHNINKISMWILTSPLNRKNLQQILSVFTT